MPYPMQLDSGRRKTREKNMKEIQRNFCGLVFTLSHTNGEWVHVFNPDHKFPGPFLKCWDDGKYWTLESSLHVDYASGFERLEDEKEFQKWLNNKLKTVEKGT